MFFREEFDFAPITEAARIFIQKTSVAQMVNSSLTEGLFYRDFTDLYQLILKFNNIFKLSFSSGNSVSSWNPSYKLLSMYFKMLQSVLQTLIFCNLLNQFKVCSNSFTGAPIYTVQDYFHCSILDQLQLIYIFTATNKDHSRTIVTNRCYY